MIPKKKKSAVQAGPLKKKPAAKKPKRAMPKWEKSSPELSQRFETFMLGFPRVVLRKMFGYPAAFVNGNMASGLWQESWVLKLSADDFAAFAVQAKARPFAPMGRPMKGFAVIPDGVLSSQMELRRWVEKSLAFVGSLPPKNKSRKK